MNRYVVGFLFSQDRERVILIHKHKPEWQKNKLNGVGGKIEEDENTHEAMTREFLEEAGVEITDWELFVHYSNENIYEVFFFKCFSNLIYKTSTQEEESIRIIPVKRLPSNLIFNLRWLIPLCLDHYIRGPIEINGA